MFSAFCLCTDVLFGPRPQSAKYALRYPYMKVALVQVLRGKDAEGANRLLQCLAKAADLLQLDGVQAVAVRPLLSKHMGTAPAGSGGKGSMHSVTPRMVLAGFARPMHSQ
jgi:hypothetical protein